MAITSFKQSTLGGLTKFSSFLAGNEFTYPSSFSLIETVELSSPSASVSFDNLDSYTSYTNLQIRVVAKGDTSFTDTYFNLQYNDDSTSSYASHRTIGTSGGVLSSSSSTSATDGNIGSITGQNSNASDFGSTIIDITDFSSSTKNTVAKSIGGSANFACGFFSCLYLKTDAVTKITIIPDAGSNFVAGSRFSLYGFKG